MGSSRVCYQHFLNSENMRQHKLMNIHAELLLKYNIFRLIYDKKNETSQLTSVRTYSVDILIN